MRSASNEPLFNSGLSRAAKFAERRLDVRMWTDRLFIEKLGLNYATLVAASRDMKGRSLLDWLMERSPLSPELLLELHRECEAEARGKVLSRLIS